MKPFSSAPRAPLCVAALAAAAGTALGAAFPSTASAQTTLAPVVVIGSRTPLPRERVAADVVVIDAERIRASTADSLEDLLRREAGLGLARSGGPGQQAGIFIRGSASANTVVLIDGVRIGSATAGLTAFEGIGLAQIERIEVLRGPASSLYGADAVGGVVQIFTRRGGEASRIGARLAVGGYGSNEAEASASGRLGAVDVAAGLSREHSRGLSALRPGDPFASYNPDADGYTRETANVRFGIQPATGHRLGLTLRDSRLKSAYDSAVYLPPNFDADPSPDFRSRLKTQSAVVDYAGTLSTQWATRLSFAHSSDDLSSGAVGIPDDASSYVTRREQLTWQNTYAFNADHQALLLLERLNERAQSSVYAADVSRANTAVVLGYTGHFGAHDVQADLRHDSNSVYGGASTGRLGWSLALNDEWRVRALAGSSFRAPSFNDLVYPGYGVISVKPERGRSVEVGLNWQAGGSRAAATVYRNRVSELIAYEPNIANCPPGYNFGCARNVNRARLQGLTLEGSHRAGPLNAGASFNLLGATDVATGQRLVRRAPRQLSVHGDYAFGAFTLGAEALGVSRRPDVGGVMLGGYAVLDLRARWQVAPAWQVEAKLLNVANRDVEPVAGYQGLGRQAWLAVRYEGAGW